MRFEWWILISVWVVATGTLFFIPKNKIRLGSGLFVQAGNYFSHRFGSRRIRFAEVSCLLFASVNRTSFTYEYYAFPVMCALFNVWYPNDRSIVIQSGYYVGWTSVLTILEVIIEKYTDLIEYIHWEWYVTWITVCLTFFMTRLFCVWFFTKGKLSTVKP